MKGFQLQVSFAVCGAALLATGCAGSNGTLPNGTPQSVTSVRHVSGSGTYSMIFSLAGSGSQGSGPTTVPYVDASGALYGQADSGGSGYGTVFKLTPNGSGYSETTLHSFTGGSGDGQDPFGELTGDANGAIYGTTYGGVLYGTVFKLTPSGSTYRYDILYSFQAGLSDGANPNGGVIVGKKGELFGTTSAGGNFDCYGRGCGTVFKMVRNGNTYTESVIYTFKGGSDGQTPIASLVMDKKGALYGTTEFGGSAGQGTIFRLKPSNGGYKETILHTFTGPSGDGQNPEGTLALDKHGNLYGTANTGGVSSCHCGAVYTLKTSGKKYHILYSFPGGSGGSALRSARVAFGANGTLYVTAYQGGPGDVGALVSLTPSKSGYVANVLHGFTGYGSDGAGPYDGVATDGKGHYFGTTVGGGSGETGTAFEFTP